MTFRKPSFLACLAWIAAAALAGCAPGPKPPQISGDFDLVLTLEPHSLQRVDALVINNFHCPYCAKFDKAEPQLARKYGKRLSIAYVDVILDDATRKAAIAHYLAQKQGRGEEVRHYLFRSLGHDGPGTFDPRVLRQKFGVDIASITAAEVASLERRSRFAYKVAYRTPTVILQGQIAMLGDAGQISGVLDQLLLPETSP
jgi:thiol-disulfide isomerase/thioredoxin